VEGTNGLFVEMPSRKVSSHCPNCRQKNQLRAGYCNFCGKKLPPPRPQPEGDGRSRMHKDLAHPITAEFREVVQTKVIAAYETELEQAPEPAKRHARPPKERQPHEDRLPERTEAHTDADGMEDIEPLAVSEYDALIADLKKTSGSSNHRDTRAASQRSREKLEEPRDLSEMPAKKSRPAKLGDERMEASRSDRRASETDDVPPDRELARTTTTEPDVAGTEPEGDDSDDFGEGIL